MTVFGLTVFGLRKTGGAGGAMPLFVIGDFIWFDPL